MVVYSNQLYIIDYNLTNYTTSGKIFVYYTPLATGGVLMTNSIQLLSTLQHHWSHFLTEVLTPQDGRNTSELRFELADNTIVHVVPSKHVFKIPSGRFRITTKYWRNVSSLLKLVSSSWTNDCRILLWKSPASKGLKD